MTAIIEPTNRELEEVVERMDELEKVVFLHTIGLMKLTKSKGWRTRRLNDFIRWFKDKNGIVEGRA